MLEGRYHATTHNRVYPDMSNVNKILHGRQNLSAHLRTMGRKKVIINSFETNATDTECQESFEYMAIIHYSMCI